MATMDLATGGAAFIGVGRPLWLLVCSPVKPAASAVCDARHVSPESSFLEGSKKPTAPRLGNAGEPGPAALIAHKTRGAIASEGSPTRRHVGPQQQE